jgi:hypothetical protein
MAQPEFKLVTTEFDPPQPGLLNVDGVGLSGASCAQGPDPEDEAAFRGVIAIDVPREVIARFTGTLILNELPKRQPEIVFERGRRFRNDEDK